jgi:vesicle-associated membrane protein 7
VVARGSTVLCEHTAIASTSNANILALRILEKMGPEDAMVSYSQEKHMFHCSTRDAITCMVVAEEAAGRRIPFGFLEDVRARFMSAYGDAVKDAVAVRARAWACMGLHGLAWGCG